MFTLKLDLTELKALVSRLEIFAKTTPRIASAVVIGDIKRKTQSGIDADNKAFSEYGPSQRDKRERAGKQVAFKDLTFTGGLLNSLYFSNDMVTVGADYQDIAHGQMYHPRWSDDKHSKFLLVGSDTVTKIKGSILQALERL